MKNKKENSLIWKFIFEELLVKEIFRVDCTWGDLLYEFPAQTRLTVYRRLDILSDASFSKSSKFGKKLENYEKSRNFEKLSRAKLLLCELSEREPGWRFTARCHNTGA